MPLRIALKSWVERHFGFVLLIALLVGLFMPGIEAIPEAVIPYFMVGVIYFSVSKIRREDVSSIGGKEALILYVLRFLILPILAFIAIKPISSDYAYALLLFLMLPTGATLAAVAAIVGGNAVLALGMTVLTSFTIPFSMPYAFEIFSQADISIDAVGMLKSLAFMVFMPIVLFFLTSRFIPHVVPVVREYASFGAIITISMIVVVIVASQRNIILGDLWFMFQAASIGIFVYMLLYVAGWYLYRRRIYSERVTYSLICGNNNIALGISIAFLYLPASITVILVMWEISWLIGLSLFQYMIREQRKAG